METREKLLSSRAARIVFALTAVTSLCAAVAAAPSEPARMSPADPTIAVPIKAAFGDRATALRPLGRGPAILVGRAYGSEDEDCTVAITRVRDRNGNVHVTRGMACAN